MIEFELPRRYADAIERLDYLRDQGIKFRVTSNELRKLLCLKDHDDAVIYKMRWC